MPGSDEPDSTAGESWWNALVDNGFDDDRTTVISATGVSMYLTREASNEVLRQVADFAAGSVLAMTFMLPLDLVADAERPMQENVERAARGSGTPFLSHYAPEEMLDMCREAGFSTMRHVSPDDLNATSPGAPTGCGRPAPSTW